MASVIRGSDNFDSLVHQGIGVNQTWQNVTASRSVGVTYTNSTGKPIAISIYEDGCLAAGLYWNANIYVDGMPVSKAQTQEYGAASCQVVNAFVIVPNGSTYRCEHGSASYYWYELR